MQVAERRNRIVQASSERKHTNGSSEMHMSTSELNDMLNYNQETRPTRCVHASDDRLTQKRAPPPSPILNLCAQARPGGRGAQFYGKTIHSHGQFSFPIIHLIIRCDRRLHSQDRPLVGGQCRSLLTYSFPFYLSPPQVDRCADRQNWIWWEPNASHPGIVVGMGVLKRFDGGRGMGRKGPKLYEAKEEGDTEGGASSWKESGVSAHAPRLAGHFPLPLSPSTVSFPAPYPSLNS